MPRPNCISGLTRILVAIGTTAPLLAQTAAVTGRVTDTVQSKGLAAVVVKLGREAARDEPWTLVRDAYTATSDSEGRFQLANLPPGIYSIAFSRRGFVWPVDGKGINQEPPPIGLKAGEQRTLDLQLTPAGIISGRLLDADGDPLRDDHVELVWWDPLDKEERVRTETQSDDRGQFRFFDVPPRRYYIRATPTARRPDVYSEPNLRGAARQTPVVTYFPSARNREAATEITLRPGEEIANRDVFLLAGGIFSVRLKLGRPPEGVNLLVRLLGAGRKEYSWRSDLPGFRAVEAGSYRLVGAQTRGPGMAVESYFAQNISVNGDLELVAPAWSPTFQVSGQVTSEGPPPFSLDGLSFTLNVRDPYPIIYSGRMAKLDAKGGFSLDSVIPARYSIWWQKPGVYVKSVRVGTREFAGSDFEIADESPVTVLLGTDGGRIRGVAENAAGGSSAGTSVMAFSGDRLSYLVTTDAEGRFDMKDLRPGDYRLYAWKNSDFFRDADFAATYADQSVAVTVGPRSSNAISLRTIVER